MIFGLYKINEALRFSSEGRTSAKVSNDPSIHFLYLIRFIRNIYVDVTQNVSTIFRLQVIIDIKNKEERINVADVSK